MTVGESLVNWLQEYEGFEAADLIETDQLGAESGSYGLYKQATNSVQMFVNGSRSVTEYYYLLCRQSAKVNRSRKNNYEWMESFERWVRVKNLSRQLPSLDNNRICDSVAVDISAYMSEAADTGTAEYQVSITINYLEVIE